MSIFRAFSQGDGCINENKIICLAENGNLKIENQFLERDVIREMNNSL